MNLKVYYQNVRGLKSKLFQLYNELSASDYDIVMLIENWLNNSVLDSVCDLSKYTVYIRDRNSVNKSEGGGVLIADLKKINI